MDMFDVRRRKAKGDAEREGIFMSDRREWVCAWARERPGSAYAQAMMRKRADTAWTIHGGIALLILFLQPSIAHTTHPAAQREKTIVCSELSQTSKSQPCWWSTRVCKAAQRHVCGVLRSCTRAAAERSCNTIVLQGLLSPTRWLEAETLNLGSTSIDLTLFPRYIFRYNAMFMRRSRKVSDLQLDRNLICSYTVVML